MTAPVDAATYLRDTALLMRMDDEEVLEAIADLLIEIAETWEKRGWGYDRSPIPPDNKVLAIALAYNRSQEV